MESRKSVFAHDGQLLWIDDCPPCNTYAYFRSYLKIDSSVSNAYFRIYAKDIYELQVNEEFIGAGPCTSAPPLLYYDEWDITAKVHHGVNLFAVKIHHGGHFSSKEFSFGGLICELEIITHSGKHFFLTKPENWICGLSEAYTSDFSKNVGCVGFSERYCLDKDESLWATYGFDDSKFYNPVKGGNISKSYWQKRTIPYFTLKTKSPLVIKKEGNFVIADFGEITSGRVFIKGHSRRSGEIKISYIEAFQLGWAFSEGKDEMYSDLLTKADGQFQWKSFNKRSFRYLKIFADDCTIESIYVESYSYPLKSIGSFQCSDPMLNRLWTICEKTLRVCIDDLYNDCPHRDKSQWMDSFVSSRAALGLYGLKEMTAKAIAQHGFCSLKNGKLMSPSICGESLLPDYALVYIHFVLWHFHVTGDLTALENLFPGILEIMVFFKKFQDSDGLLVDVDKHEGFVYLDNTFELNKKGKSAALNALYMGGAKAACEIAQHLDKVDVANKFRYLFLKLQQSFQKTFKHPEIENCFVDAAPIVKKEYLNINFSCEFGKWHGSGARARTFIYVDCDANLNFEYAVYGGIRIIFDDIKWDIPKSPSWSEQPMYTPATLSLTLKEGWNEIVFEVEANPLNWDFYFRGADNQMPQISATCSFGDINSFIVEEIEWYNGKNIDNEKYIIASLWTTPVLSQSTHGYIGFCKVNEKTESNREMLSQTIPPNGYTRNYLSLRVPFFCRETKEKNELENWILPCNTPWPAFFYISSLFKCDMEYEALAWIRMAWGKMLEMDAVNCWEEWGDRSSLCHAWGASPAYFFHHEILGVKHEWLWQGIIVIKPNLLDLNHASGTVAIGDDSKNGVSISLKKNGDYTIVEIDVATKQRICLDTSKLHNPRVKSKAKLNLVSQKELAAIYDC